MLTATTQTAIFTAKQKSYKMLHLAYNIAMASCTHPIALSNFCFSHSALLILLWANRNVKQHGHKAVSFKTSFVNTLQISYKHRAAHTAQEWDRQKSKHSQLLTTAKMEHNAFFTMS